MTINVLKNSSLASIETNKPKLSPIVLFVYNRLDHTRQTIEALKKNQLAQESELFIFSDAGKNEQSSEDVAQIREYLKHICGFKRVSITERETNFGLAKNIIDGVTEIIDKYGKVIVLEDDMVTSPAFLNFMNDALDFYEKEKKVWHISGWNYPIDVEGLGDAFLWRRMNCWGWGTWANRWRYYERNPQKLLKEYTSSDIRRLNLDGAHDCWAQVVDNARQKISTWAIFWQTVILRHEGLCLNPSQSYLHNIGLDGSGVNCDKNSSYTSDGLNQRYANSFPTNLVEFTPALERVKSFYYSNKRNILIRIIHKICNFFTKKLSQCRKS